MSVRRQPFTWHSKFKFVYLFLMSAQTELRFISPCILYDVKYRHAGHCWRSRDELISDVLLWTPTYGRVKAGRPARTYSSSVRIRNVALMTCQRRWTIGKSGERGSGISELAARRDDDDAAYSTKKKKKKKKLPPPPQKTKQNKKPFKNY